MTEDIKSAMLDLVKKFNIIRKMEYVEAVNDGFGSVGATFEKLIGKESDSLSIPDYHGIEIKTRRSYSKSLISLFCSLPIDGEKSSIENLKNSYGYPDKELSNFKVLFGSISGDKLYQIGSKYKFMLDIDYKKERIYLCICNRRGMVIDKNNYWEFSDLKNKLCQKLKYLALIDAWPNRINGKMYYKYYKINYYVLKNFDAFLNLIASGKIFVTFRISVFKSGDRYGQTHNHGVSFGIGKEHLQELYYPCAWL